MMGDVNLLPPESFKASQIISPNAVKILSGDYFSNFQALMQSDNLNNPFYLFENQKAEKKRLLNFR